MKYNSENPDGQDADVICSEPVSLSEGIDKMRKLKNNLLSQYDSSYHDIHSFGVHRINSSCLKSFIKNNIKDLHNYLKL